MSRRQIVPAGGFTLIELLIVVAIIAILAAIAVPNFLEAQVRSKVSRVRADLRSLATAQEAYFTDWNSYTCRDMAHESGRIEGWSQLTTPVAYTSSIPTDPFGTNRYRGSGDGGQWLPALYEMGTGIAGVRQSGWFGEANLGLPSNTYEMNSSGPDKYEDTSGAGGLHQWSWADYQYPWIHIPADSDAAVAELLSLIYDSTNGTRSKGEVFRTGGTKPPGKVFDYLFSIGSGQ